MPLRYVRDVLAALRVQGADRRLLGRLEAVVENRCGDPVACERCEARCLDATERTPADRSPAERSPAVPPAVAH